MDSKWRYLRASTFFEFSDFADLHRRLKMAMKDTKFYKMMPPLPARPNTKKASSNDHAGQVREGAAGFLLESPSEFLCQASTVE